MLAELAAANAAFAVIKQAVTNGKEIAAAGSAIAEFVGAKAKLQAKAAKKGGGSDLEEFMALEKITLKNVKVTVNFDIDLDTLKRFLETKERDCDDLMAIYDMICTQSDRLNEQGEPENIRAYFDIDPETFNLLEKQVKTDLKKSYVTDSEHPHLRRIK